MVLYTAPVSEIRALYGAPHCAWCPPMPSMEASDQSGREGQSAHRIIRKMSQSMTSGCLALNSSPVVDELGEHGQVGICFVP